MVGVISRIARRAALKHKFAGSFKHKFGVVAGLRVQRDGVVRELHVEPGLAVNAAGGLVDPSPDGGTARARPCWRQHAPARQLPAGSECGCAACPSCGESQP